jgi:hypothetical protein
MTECLPEYPPRRRTRVWGCLVAVLGSALLTSAFLAYVLYLLACLTIWRSNR